MSLLLSIACSPSGTPPAATCWPVSAAHCEPSTPTHPPPRKEPAVADHVELRTGAYYDSVTLMQVSRAVAATPGVEAAQVAMATELNLDVLRGMGFDVPPSAPNDLVVALRGDEAGIAAGQAALEAALAGSRSAAGGSGAMGEAPPPRTLGGAIRLSGADLALVSVPGEHA